MLRFIYAGHAIPKYKYVGVYRCNGSPFLSIEVHLNRNQIWLKTDVKYLYGRTANPNEEIEYVNAAHIFSDMLSMSQGPRYINAHDLNTPGTSYHVSDLDSTVPESPNQLNFSGREVAPHYPN